VSAMQCNVECRLPEEDVILKDSWGAMNPPPRTPLVHIMYERATPTNAQNAIVFLK